MSNIPTLSHASKDTEVLTRVGVALTLLQRHSLRRIRVTINNGLVTLAGEVPSFFDRQLAVEATRRVPGVTGVQVDLVVLEPEAIASFGATFNRLTHVAAAAATALVMVVAVTGCGKAPEIDRVQVFPVEGRVVIGGKPVPNAVVVLHPKSGDAKLKPARGKSNENGEFKLTTYNQNDGAAEGDYAVTITSTPAVKTENGYEAGPNILPPKFARKESTSLSVHVAEGPNQLGQLELR